MTADEIIAELGLEPLPLEGGHWAQVWIDEHATAIYFLLQPHDFSAFHRLTGTELYHHYAGAPAELWQLRPDGTSGCDLLGSDLAAGERPAVVVPAAVWQGSRTLGAWSLLGCTMAPPFQWDGLEMAERSELLAAYPDRAEVIEALSHQPGPSRP
ncbi:MAG: cupin domain-containing protein [Acidimicrobiales bacterium]